MTPSAQFTDDIVVIGASTGGQQPLQQVLSGLPAGFPAAVLIVMHIGVRDSILPSVLAQQCQLPIKHAHSHEALLPGRVLVAPPDRHLMVLRDGHGAYALLSRSARENHCRPAIDPLFRSAAAAFGPRAIGVILSGRLDDGTIGMQAIKTCGGQAIVQLPEDAAAPDMPASAIEFADVDRVMRAREIAPILSAIVDANRAGAQLAAPVPEWVNVENRFVSEDMGMDELAKIGQPSAFTCPDCNGALFQINGTLPPHYRCHTGHAFSERNLSNSMLSKVEDALWSAVRALHEKEKLYRQMARSAHGGPHTRAAEEYVEQALDAQRKAEVLRTLIGSGTLV
ncbi:chemotaxis protein CheB [Pseudoduganella sp. UC29_106]|uniref:chemotaxis protein CheB n=1 Tax=Pseudoduganella sp. UC29_106 TaxID=3374553 RepID=UPI0037578788